MAAGNRRLARPALPLVCRRTDEHVLQRARPTRRGRPCRFKQAVVVDRLPKTRSGKILRGTMRRIADGETYATPATIEDPVVLDEITDALERIGYGRIRAAVGR
jgi:propionyl-CoA synthetase